MKLGTRMIVMMAVALLAASGCSSAAENIVENAIENQLDEEGGSGNVDVNVDEDEGSVSIETDEGSVVIGGNEIPEDFPLPIPDYEEVSGVITQNDDGGTYSQVILSFDPEDLDDVADLYEGFFNDQDWDVSRTNSSAEGSTFTMISGTSDEVNASAIIAYDEGEDFATLSLSYATNE